MSGSPAPKKLESMPTRRAPLASIPNAVNSPYRPAPSAAFKRSRFELDAKEDLKYNQQPPAKRLAVDNGQTRYRTPPRKQTTQYSEDRVFAKRPTASQPNAFERKLLAAKERQTNYDTERQEKTAAASLNGIRQWQKHYRRVFPYFVFYFESIPDDVRVKYSKFVRVLGAREEKFFSKDVTHVITTRVVPAESESTSPTDSNPPSISTRSPAAPPARTINPSVLEKTTEPTSSVQPSQARNKFTFETALGRKPPPNSLRESEPKKNNASNVDVLSKAKEMGMKIWQLEKLQRIMNSMFDTSSESKSQHGRNTRSVAGLKDERAADLSRMLRNEQLNGPSDRDSTVTSVEMITFKGPYIYIRDMDERTKPMIVREFPKVSRNENGEWPQFRSVSAGKCPFVEEAPGRLEMDKAKAREEKAIRKQEAQSPRRTRAAAAMQKSQGPAKIPAAKPRLHQPLEERKDGMNSVIKAWEECAPPPIVPTSRRSPMKGLRNLSAIIGPKMFGGEPAASGLQPSNITSAIRSQMISSTAAAPGAKAGTSKEFQGLKRKVLERNSGPGLSNIQISQKVPKPSGPTRTERSIAVAKQPRAKAQEKLIHIEEESTQSEADEDIWRADEVRRVERPSSKSIAEKKDPKPGYCENCRDKYEDFDEHIVGRKHKKFALSRDNWRDLDKLLVQLGRRLKDEDSDDF